MDARLQGFLKWDVFVAQQQAAQPTVVKTLLLFVVSFLGLREFTRVLFLWPGFAASARANHDLYVGIFFGAQLVISAVFAAWMGWRFRAALFQPRPATSWRGYIVVLLIAAPVLVHEGYPAIRHSASIITLVTMKPEYMEGLMRDMWTAVTGGYTIWHVAFAAAITFVSPVLEEIVFTGLTLNRLSRRVPLAVAMLICAGLFAGVHFLSIMKYVAENIPKLLCMSITAQLIRLVSGRLSFSIAFHVLADVLVYIPKWVLAYLYFSGRNSWS